MKAGHTPIRSRTKAQTKWHLHIVSLSRVLVLSQPLSRYLNMFGKLSMETSVCDFISELSKDLESGRRVDFENWFGRPEIAPCLACA